MSTATTPQPNIWQSLPRPFFCLAPMEDVTDTVFRRMVADFGKPDLFFTEFVSVEGLTSPGRDAISHRLAHTDAETPLIAQIWGTNPDNFYTIARQIAAGEFGPFAGIDLNMGCPDNSIVKRGACAGLIDYPERALAIVQATQAGAGALPVSVKTRCGTNLWQTEAWAETLLTQKLAALTIHGRIAKEKSTFPARWEEIAKVVALRDALAPETIIVGNGDVTSVPDGLEKAAASGVDGLMVGRGIFKNLWLFDPTLDPDTLALTERLDLLATHIRLWRDTWAGYSKHFDTLKKLYKSYFAGVPFGAEMRIALMELHTVEETLEAIAAMRARSVDEARSHQGVRVGVGD
jgi:tRNA-dihydrouridine synthase